MPYCAFYGFKHNFSGIAHEIKYLENKKTLLFLYYSLFPKLGASTIKCNECIFKNQKFSNSTENLTYRIKRHKIDCLENKIPLSFYFIVFFPKLSASTIKCNKCIFKNQKISNSTEKLIYWIKGHKIDYLENKNPLSFYFINFFPNWVHLP